MQKKFFVYNQNTVNNYSYKIHCQEEKKNANTPNSVTTKASAAISASESETYGKLGSHNIATSFMSILQYRHNYIKHMKDDG